MAPVDQTIIQAKVSLQDIEPPIWRRLLLPPSLNLAELHHVLQAAFGWRDEHLHEFIIGGLVYGAPELADEAAAEDDPRTFEATDIHLRDFDRSCSTTTTSATAGCTSSPSNSGSPKTLASNTRPASTAPAIARPRTSAERPATSGSSKPGATPLTKSTRPCASGPDAPSIPEKFDLQATDKAVKTACRKARGDYVFRRQ